MPVIRYFQTAVFSVGFDLDATEHERSSRQEPANAKGYVRTSFILQQQLAKQSSVIGGNQKYCLRKFAKLEEVFKNCTIKSQDGRGLGREGDFGSLASIQLSDAGNGKAQIAFLHVIMKHSWYRKETLTKCKIASANQS